MPGWCIKVGGWGVKNETNEYVEIGIEKNYKPLFFLKSYAYIIDQTNIYTTRIGDMTPNNS